MMVVDFPLLDGEWVQGADYPGGWMHAVWSVAVEPFKDIVDLERLNTRAPDLRIDDPLVDDYSDLEPSDREPEHSQDHSGAHGTIEPPVKLAGLEDVKLFSYAKNSPEIERFVGYGRTSEGEEVILTARFRLQDGRRIEDPQLPGQPLNEVNCVPLSPFGDLIEPKPLFSREPDLSIENPAVDLMADDLASRSR